MTLEELLNYPDLQLVVLERRYGGGYLASVEIDGLAVTTTGNDLNGEEEWEFYGLWSSDSWYPVSSGDTVKKAVENLEAKLSSFPITAVDLVGLGLNILRQTNKTPDQDLLVGPKTLGDLHTWINEWNKGILTANHIFKQ